MVEEFDDAQQSEDGLPILKKQSTEDGLPILKKKNSGSAVKSTLPPSPVGGQNDPNFLGLTNNQPQTLSPFVNPAEGQKLNPHAVAINRAKQNPPKQVTIAPENKDSSLADNISEMLYIPALNKAFSDLVIKPAAGATDFLDRTIDKAYQAVTGDATPDWLRKKGAFHDLSNWVDKGYEQRRKPTNIVSETAEGMVGTLPLIASLYTGQGEATLAAKTPQFISHVTKLLATTGALNAYKDATDKGEGYVQSLGSAVKGGGEGALTGLTLDAQMLVGGALGKGVANKLAQKGLLKGGKAGEAILHALSVGSIFGGTAAGEDLLNGRDIDTHNVAKQFGMGLAFEALPVAKALGQEVGEHIEKSDLNKKAAQTASLSSAASNLNAESAVRTLMQTPVDQIKAINENIKDGHEDLYANSIEQGAKAYDEKNVNEKRALYADQLLLKTQADVKLMASKIKASPDEFVNSIQESTELEPQQKQDLLEKVQALTNGETPAVEEAPEAVQTAVDPSLANSEVADPALSAEEAPDPSSGEIPAPTGEVPTDGSEVPNFEDIKKGDKVSFDRYGNEPLQEWEIVGDSPTRGGKKAYQVQKTLYEDDFQNEITKDEWDKKYPNGDGNKHEHVTTVTESDWSDFKNRQKVEKNTGEAPVAENATTEPVAVAEEAPVTRQKVNDADAPTLDELKTNLPETGKEGISIEPAFKKDNKGNFTEEPLDNGTQKIVSRDKEGKINGVLEVSYNGKDGQQEKPVSVKVVVDEASRRQGIATKLFKHAQENGIDVESVRGKETTDAGQALFEANRSKSAEILVEKSTGEPEDKTTTLRNADVEAKRAEYGFQEPVPRKGTTDAEFDAKADEQIKAGVDAHELMDKVLIDKKPITGVESVILSKYQGTKEAELLDVNDKIEKATDSSSTTFSQLVADRDRVLEDLQRAYDASEASGTVASDALRARKVRVAQDASLAGFLVRERMQVNKGEKLSQEQIKAVSDEYKDIQQKNEAYQKKIAELQEQLKTVGAEKILKRVQEEVKLETRRNKRAVKVEQLDKDIEDTFAALKKIAREKRGTLSANPIPVEYLPELAKLVKLYTQKGATTLTGIVDELYHGLKDDIEGLTKDHVLEAISNLPETTKKDPLKAMKSRLKSSIRRVQEKTEAEDFTPTKKNKIVLDEEALKLRDELEKARYEYELRLHRDAYKNRTKKQKVLDAFTEVINTPRALLASTDFSAPLRQGLVPTIAHPILAARAFTNMFKAAFSQNHFDRWFYDLKEAPDYATIKESKLYVSDPHKPELAAKEEQFMNNLAEKIPFFGKLVRGSERAYVGYLNKLRVDLFRQTTELYESQGKTIANSPELYKGLGKFINNATGRGDFTNENLAQSLNLVLFSPRLIASRLNLLNPVWYSKLPKEVRYQAIGDMAKFIGVGVSLLALAKANGFQVEADPRSADFGKLRSGDKRWDIWGGFSQYVRLFAQELMGQTKSTSTGDITPLGGDKFGARTRLDVVASFMRNKLSPVPAFIANTLAGKDAMGQEFDPVASIPKNLIPLTLQDTYQAVQKEGLRGMFSTGIPTTFGVGVQTYSDLKPAKEVEPKNTIEVANGSKYQLTEPQLAERKKYNDEWLAKHEDKQRVVYLKAANNDPELKMEIATKSAKYRSMGQDKSYIDAHRQSLIDNYVTKKLSAAANKYSKMQMLKKYRGQKGQYNLQKSEE